MPSIRDQLLTEWVSRIDAIEGFSAALRADVNAVDTEVHCIVYPIGEDKRPDTNQTYLSTFRVEGLLIVRMENADATLDGDNPYRYLDRMVTEVEKTIHTPDEWAGPETDVWIDGHDVVEPNEENELAARISITFRYRHDYQDPTQ